MNFLVMVLLLAAFVLSVLSYYKLNPERVVMSVPFALLALPLALFVAFIAISAAGVPPLWSGVALLVAFVVLGVAVAQARCLLPRAKR